MVFQGATREAIRVAVGRNLGAVELINAATGGSTTTFLTDDLEGTTADQHKGAHWLGTDTPNDGVQSRVTASTMASNRTTLTLAPAVSSTLASDTAELWKAYNPKDIHDFINQAIREITGLAYDPEESLALHADGRQARLDLPSEFAMLNRVEFRDSVESVTIHNATSAWDESVHANVTASKDTKDYKLGPGSFKMIVAAGAPAGAIFATKALSPSKNISGMDYVEFWIKSTVATTAGALQLLLDDTAACVSQLETLNIPALLADTWTYVRIALDNPELDTAIISVGLKQDSDVGACTVWLNDVKAVLESTAHWAPLPKHLWGIDKEARDLVLTPSGVPAVGYALLKLTGGDKPATLDADATVCEVSDWYVICRATALALMSNPGGPATDPDNRRQAAGGWELLAQQAKIGHHLPQNVRLIS